MGVSMHGLVNRAIQVFVRDTYGVEAWKSVVRSLDLGFEDFESMLQYDARVTEDLVETACRQLSRERPDFLEDLGTYLVSHENVGALRRLMRFGGDTFLDFLLSLDELNDRVRLALPDLVLPALEIEKPEPSNFSIHVGSGMDGFEFVLTGVLRAMADDYGALVLLEHGGEQANQKTIDVSLLDLDFAQGRDFVLGARV